MTIFVTSNAARERAWARLRTALLELGSVPLPVVTAEIDRFIADGYPDMA